MKKFLSILTVLLFVFAFGAANKVLAAANITQPMTGSVSSDSYGEGTSVELPDDLLITEALAGDIKVGSIMLTAPAGYKFDTTFVPTIGYTGADLAGDATVTFIGETIMQFDITHVSTVAGTLTISAPKVKVTAGSPMASAGNITMSGTITGLDGTSNFGTLTQVPGAAHHLSVASEHGATEVAGTSYTKTITIKDLNNNTLDFDTDDQTCTFAVSGTPESVSAGNKPEYNNVDLV